MRLGPTGRFVRYRPTTVNTASADKVYRAIVLPLDAIGVGQARQRSERSRVIVDVTATRAMAVGAPAARVRELFTSLVE